MSMISIIKGSITTLEVDAIVNAANEDLLAGGGVCGAIFKEAGHKRLQEACNTIGHCEAGSAVITSGFDLKSKYIIHAVGPRWLDGCHGEPELLRSAYKKALELAVEYNCHSVGFPLLSAGTFGYPMDLAWDQAICAYSDFINERPDVSISIIFAVLSNDVMRVGREKIGEIADSFEDGSVISDEEVNEDQIRLEAELSDDTEDINDPVVYEEDVTENKETSGMIKRAKNTVKKKIDQNSDGTIDVKDIALIAGNIGSSVRKVASEVKTGVKQNRNQLGAWADHTRKKNDIKTLQPIFEELINGPEFSMTKLIRIAERDKRHAESEVCKGALGHMSDFKGVSVVNIYPEYVDSFGLTFYPDRDSEVYYVDPCDRDHYIALKDYFDYLKIVRVNELQKIAQDLGAKHFRVTYMEETKSSTERKESGKLRMKRSELSAEANAEHNHSGQSYSTLEVSAEMDCLGHAAIEPKLVYFQKDPSIKNLIQMRMSDNQIIHQSIVLKCVNSSGIKEKDAAKIDTALTAMKCNMSATLTNEVKKESKRVFEYEIDF